VIWQTRSLASMSDASASLISLRSKKTSMALLGELAEYARSDLTFD
jgi:hypothetical protein